MDIAIPIYSFLFTFKEKPSKLKDVIENVSTMIAKNIMCLGPKVFIEIIL